MNQSQLFNKEQILSRLLEQLWHVLLLVSVIGATASIQRFRFTGWLPIYSLHLMLMLGFTCCWMLRHKIPFAARIITILVVFYSVGISALFTFGLIGGGIWWLILSTLIANLFYSLRTGILHGIFCLFIFSLAGIGYTQGYLSIPFDANEYITRPTTWLTLMVGCVLLSMFIINAIITYQGEILKMLGEAEESRRQKDLLIKEQQQALDEIQMLRSIIPICAGCKKIRDDEGFWETVEGYFQKHSEIQFSHSICPDCGESLYGDEWHDANSGDKESSTNNRSEDEQ